MDEYVSFLTIEQLNQIIMDNTERVIKTMKSAGKPMKAVEIAELAGLDKKEVDKAIKDLKSKDLVFSPKVCFWQAK